MFCRLLKSVDELENQLEHFTNSLYIIYVFIFESSKNVGVQCREVSNMQRFSSSKIVPSPAKCSLWKVLLYIICFNYIRREPKSRGVHFHSKLGCPLLLLSSSSRSAKSPLISYSSSLSTGFPAFGRVFIYTFILILCILC